MKKRTFRAEKPPGLLHLDLTQHNLFTDLLFLCYKLHHDWPGQCTRQDVVLYCLLVVSSFGSLQIEPDDVIAMLEKFKSTHAAIKAHSIVDGQSIQEKGNEVLPEFQLYKLWLEHFIEKLSERLENAQNGQQTAETSENAE